ncbi:hypothetical protein J8273_7709 [Carpediemonas membranifera]|uniref:Uncharacterized protein n=1 Tax=Carpediemonas membranifera TaxID=201153 RepID=A0A8J6ASH1_9EUKA|nr:hypothetical protein J8273_7709 [Carpediemonas membranifera]|eukprot:KAG9390360.1 hypothetical protein J8273_7709 [Carpediemonas membranifera]
MNALVKIMRGLPTAIQLPPSLKITSCSAPTTRRNSRSDLNPSSISIETLVSFFDINLTPFIPQPQVFKPTEAVAMRDLQELLLNNGHAVDRLSMRPFTIANQYEVEGRTCTFTASVHGLTTNKVPIIIFSPDQLAAGMLIPTDSHTRLSFRAVTVRLLVSMAMLVQDTSQAILVYRDDYSIGSVSLFTARLAYEWLQYRRTLLYNISFFCREVRTDAEEERARVLVHSMACDVFSHKLAIDAASPRLHDFQSG